MVTHCITGNTTLPFNKFSSQNLATIVRSFFPLNFYLNEQRLSQLASTKKSEFDSGNLDEIEDNKSVWEKENIWLYKFEDDEVAIPDIDVRMISCVGCEDQVAHGTDLHPHFQSVHRKDTPFSEMSP